MEKNKNKQTKKLLIQLYFFKIKKQKNNLPLFQQVLFFLILKGLSGHQ